MYTFIKKSIYRQTELHQRPPPPPRPSRSMGRSVCTPARLHQLVSRRASQSSILRGRRKVQTPGKVREGRNGAGWGKGRDKASEERGGRGEISVAVSITHCCRSRSVVRCDASLIDNVLFLLGCKDELLDVDVCLFCVCTEKLLGNGRPCVYSVVWWLREEQSTWTTAVAVGWYSAIVNEFRYLEDQRRRLKTETKIMSESKLETRMVLVLTFLSARVLTRRKSCV